MGVGYFSDIANFKEGEMVLHCFERFEFKQLLKSKVRQLPVSKKINRSSTESKIDCFNLKI
jgi:hypothetical protein